MSSVSAALVVCIGFTEVVSGLARDEFHHKPLEGAGKETKLVAYAAAVRWWQLGGGFAERKDCVSLLEPAGVEPFSMVAEIAVDGFEVCGGNLLARLVEVADDASLTVCDVLIHSCIIVGNDAFAAGDLFEEGHADALLGAWGDVHAETVEERAVFFGRQEVALDDKFVKCIGFKQRTDCCLVEIAAVPV